jgi:E3 ubiquitin-protein ligase HUWE1
MIPVPPSFRSRPGGVPAPRSTDEGTNPLLQRNSGTMPGSGRSDRGGEAFSDWMHAIDPSQGPGHRGTFSMDTPVSLISNLIHAVTHGGGARGAMSTIGDNLTFHISGGNGPLPNDLEAMFGPRRPPVEASRPTRDDPHQAVNFVPNSTTGRWLQESQILFGNDPTSKAHLILNAILGVLAPPAIAEDRIRKKQESDRVQLLAIEHARKAEADRLAKEKVELEEKLACEMREREDIERAEVEAAAATARGLESTPEHEVAVEEGAMEGVEPTQSEVVQPPAAEPAETSTSAAPENRVFANFHGRQLDITSLAIDPDYLDALPEEIREEVLLAQIAEHRSQAATSGEQATELNREFLDALPDEIRDELLDHEATERRRREQAQAQAQARQAQATGDVPPRAEEMDPASFLASLSPVLRESVLMEQDEEMLSQLPPAIAAEGRLLGRLGRSDPRLRQLMDNSSRLSRGRVLDHDRLPLPPMGRRAQKKSTVQMLDKAGVATLLRLMFISQHSSGKSTLHSILRNVCQNRQNRAEVVSLLLSILQDGTADMNAVERSFTRLSVRARQTPASKDKQILDRPPSAHMSLADTDLSPLMVVTHCLQTLIFLTSQNLREFSLFFLTEHEAPSILKRSRKGKAKETKSSKYPLNSLLSLLDRKLILESSTAMEHLSSLLNSITQPLTMLLKPKDKPAEPEGVKTSTTAEAQITSEPPASNEPSPESNTPEAVSRTATNASADQSLPDAPPVADAQASAPSDKKIESGEGPENPKKERTFAPPVVPDENLRLVVNILAARECSSKTFQATLTTINSLSNIPDTKIVFGRELVRQAQALGKSILVDLDELVPEIQQAETDTDVQGLARDKFSPASSDQAKLLRVLTALDYIFDSKRKDSSRAVDKEDAPQQESLVNAVYEASTFGPLWAKLSDCLAAIRNRDSMLNIATILLPLIEALMVVCKNTTLKDKSMAMSQRDFAVSSPAPEDRLENLFFKFTEEHRKILNDLVRNNPKLMSGTFSLLVKNPKVLEFDNKRSYFTRRLHSRGSEARHPHPPLQLSVRRDFVFLDSFKSLYFKSAKEMKYGKLSIRFHGEEGVDAGGVTREWFQVLSRQMFDPGYVLFKPVASDKTTFHPNPSSSINDEHLMFFKFIGRVIGKALYEGRVLDCHFSRAVYKRILGRVVSVKDMEDLDLEYSKSLKWMLENDITDIITETFSYETDDFGANKVIDLLPDGRNIPVTEENKAQYVQLVVEYRLTGSIQEQLEHFLSGGFHGSKSPASIANFQRLP